MNRIITLLCFAFLFNSCARKEYLDLIQLPNIVNGSIYRTDKFSDDEFFSATNSGIYLQFGQHDFVEYSWNDIGVEFTSSEIRLAEVNYANETLFIVYNGKCVTINRTNHYYNEHGFFFRPTSSIAPDGTPIVVGFGKIVDPNNNGSLEYVISIERFNGSSIDRVEETGMHVPAATYGTFGISFTDGSLLIAANPLFICSDWKTTASTFVEYDPSIANSYSGIIQPHKEGNVVYGYFNAPSPNSPVDTYYQFDLNTRTVSNTKGSSVCTYPANNSQVIKHLDWEAATCYLYLNTNLGYVDVGSPLLYLQKFDQLNGNCEMLEILSTDLLQSTYNIKDVGYFHSSNNALISTSSGLFVYNFETKTCSKFIDQILEI